MLRFADVKSKFPEVFETERGNGACYVVHCWKYHKSGGVYQMEIRQSDGIFHCHNCGHAGSIYEEFPDHFDDLAEHLSWVRIKSEGTISSAAPKAPRINRGGIMWSPTVTAPGETIPFASLADDHPAVIYLRDRGFDIQELRSFSVTSDIRALYYCTRGQIPVADGLGTLTGRIIFPVYGEDLVSLKPGDPAVLCPVLKGWQARQVEKNEVVGGEEVKKVWQGFSWRTFRKKDGVWEDKLVPKYYTMPGLKKSTVLGGMAHAKGFPDVAIVEGPLDHYMTGRHSVFTLGKSVSKDQIRLLQANWRRVFLLRDPGVDPGDKKFNQMIMDMYPLIVHHLVLADQKDPGATPRPSIWNQIADHVGDPTLRQYAETSCEAR
jgi:hypothetical protein